MPTYEYECESCGHHFERFQPITARPVRHCERCGCRVHRVLAPVGIIFRGSGFHVNDYSSTGPKYGGSNGRKRKSEDMAETIKSTSTSSRKESGGKLDL